MHWQKKQVLLGAHQPLRQVHTRQLLLPSFQAVGQQLMH